MVGGGIHFSCSVGMRWWNHLITLDDGDVGHSIFGTSSSTLERKHTHHPRAMNAWECVGRIMANLEWLIDPMVALGDGHMGLNQAHL